MPIPTDGAWPPPAHQPAYAAYRDWDAWYVGNPDQLRNVYANRGAGVSSIPPSQRVRPGQYAGGIVGTVSRWLWGDPPPLGERDRRLHVPLPADLAATSANLLFSEEPKLTHENPAVQQRLEQLVDDGLIQMLLHAAEANSALGDVYLRPVIDRDVYPDRAFFSAVHADGAIPTLRWGKLIEVTFWSTLLEDGDTHIRLLEHHEVVGGAGRIVYALHEGTTRDLGRVIPLTELQGAAYLAELVDEEGAQATDLDRLDVVRVPNAGPQRQWRTNGTLKYHGRSDFDGNEHLFDKIDDVWTSWMRDIALARARLVVPDYMLQSNGPGQGATFDADREIFTSITAMPNQQGTGITVAQFDIRNQEHKATADALVELALRHAGLSSQTLGEEGGDVAMTATEAQARERQSFTTRGTRIQGSYKPGIADGIELLLALEKAKFGGSRPDPVKPNVEFGDSVSESPETVARTLQLLAAAEAVSYETRVRMVHPEWDDIQVRNEVTRIKDDVGASSAPAPEITLGGLAGNNPPPAGDPSTQADQQQVPAGA